MVYNWFQIPFKLYLECLQHKSLTCPFDLICLLADDIETWARTGSGSLLEYLIHLESCLLRFQNLPNHSHWRMFLQFHTFCCPLLCNFTIRINQKSCKLKSENLSSTSLSRRSNYYLYWVDRWLCDYWSNLSCHWAQGWHNHRLSCLGSIWGEYWPVWLSGLFLLPCG